MSHLPTPSLPTADRTASAPDQPGHRRTPRPTPSARGALTAVALALLAGCASTPGPTALEQVRREANPVDRSQRAITNFTPALRCMDELMFRTGVRDVTLMMEELRDSTQRVPAAVRDMMASALSDMSRRSRALRLSTFGSDQGNLAQLLQQAQRTQPFQVVPQYSLRGAISQIDDDVQRSAVGLGAVASRLGLRVGSETRFSVLGFDAALVDSRDFTLVPGVSSKNTTIVTRRDASASDGQAQLRGLGLVFSFSAARSEGNATAARNMVELAALELVGKLTRLPYWQCLGVSDQHPEVARELDDWTLGTPMPERLRLVQERLREQRWYPGALDGLDSPALQRAVAAALAAWQSQPGWQPAQRQLLDSASPRAQDPAFFRALLTLPLPKAPAPAGVAGLGAGPLAASLRQLPGAGDGQARLLLQPQQDLFAYCYVAQTAAPGPASADPQAVATLRRVFPNRFAPDPALRAGAAVNVPGQPADFALPAGAQYGCVLTPREVYGELPAPLRWGDFEEIRLNSFAAVRDAFAQALGQPVTLVMASADAPATAEAPAPADAAAAAPRSARATRQARLSAGAGNQPAAPSAAGARAVTAAGPGAARR